MNTADSFFLIFGQFPNVEDEGRRTYSAMVAGMDMTVGRVVEALRQYGLYENSIILWSSDVSKRARISSFAASLHAVYLLL